MNGNHDVDERGRSFAGQQSRERLLAGLPVIEPWLRLAGMSTAVLVGGAGPPVILLHSAGEFAAVWARVIPDLVTTHRVIAPDLPGHGASQMFDGRLDIDRVVAWLGELIERTCPEPPTLVGHGLGGAIAARFAICRGDRLARLVLVDTLGLGEFTPEPSFGLALHRFLEQPTEDTRDELFQQCFKNLDGLREQMGQRWEPLAAYTLDRACRPSQRAALEALITHFGMPAIPSVDLALIAVPTTLIWGRHDLQAPLDVAETASARHRWPLHVIDNAADDPALEQPEAFLRALRTAMPTAVQPGAAR